MTPHIKSHFQLVKVPNKEDILAVETPFDGGRSKVLKQVKSLHMKRHLLEANQNLETFIGDQNSDTDDRFGCVLRRLRMQQGLEASIVASHACISIYQLYELETGQDTLFYTSGLRYKAAQRVAQFLGTDWSAILQGRVSVPAISAPSAQLHLLNFPRTEGQLNPAQPSQAVAIEEVQATHSGVALTPLSTAHFLRVADVQ